MHYQSGPISTVAGLYAREILWSNAGVGPDEVDVTGSYDAFTFTTLLQLEDYGFCKKGEGGVYVSDGTIRLGGRRPNNTSGGLLCEGYTHGLSMVIENVRQLRHDADDSCPSARTASASTPTTIATAAAGRCEARDQRQSRLGLSRAPAPPWSCAANEGRADHDDPGHLSRHAARPSTTSTSRTLSISSIARRTISICRNARPAACALSADHRLPVVRDAQSQWTKVEGKGTVHSYMEVHHAIQPAFKAHTPYLVLLVDLDTQEGKPTGTKRCASSATSRRPTACWRRRLVRRVGIGTRVRMVFADVAPGLAAPHWTIDEGASQPAKPWRYPQE